MSFLVRPWRGTVLWRALAYETLGATLGYVVFAVAIALVSATISLAITFIIGGPVAWCMFAVAAKMGSMERSRAAALLDVNLASPHAPLSPGSWWARLRQRLSSASRWREIGYLTLGLPVLGAFGLIALSLWATSLTLAALPFYVKYLPARSVDLGFMRIHTGRGTDVACALGILGIVLIVPQITMALAAFDRVVVRWLLGPHDRSSLKRRVDELEISRGAAIDSAESERHRIERDLHDGAQQRLVALAMNLSRARERFDTDPERARQLVDDAHDDAKAALVELRDLARGIHPAVLTDRGLDAALSAIVARCPVPVSLSIDLPKRLPASVESAAYFVVTEALTNVAKHARATTAQVSIALENNRLVVEVRDDGVGGAQESKGSGLTGITERVSALGGWTRVISPPAGPTSVMVEIPCES
jgi:signal transduction histidine kinase